MRLEIGIATARITPNWLTSLLRLPSPSANAGGAEAMPTGQDLVCCGIVTDATCFLPDRRLGGYSE